jgi:glycosyltransferase involved in cell wall biosynthesis
MRILQVSPRVVVPPRRGAAARVYELGRHLSERHEVRQFLQSRLGLVRTGQLPVTPTYRALVYANPLACLLVELGERAWVRSPIPSGRALALTRPASLRGLLEWADVTLVEFPWQFEQVRRAAGSSPVVYDAHNVERLKFASWADAAGWPRTARRWLRAVERAEAAAVAGADLILAVSPEDRAAFVELYGVGEERVAVVPNGADVERYVPSRPDERARARAALGLPERTTVLFAASDMPPNRRGLEWVRRAAERSRGLTFLVVGSVARPSRNGNLVVRGLVDDLGPYLTAADISLCPIQHGGGTKIKLLESLAAGLPVVAFGEALDGTAARPGEHVLVADKTVDSLVDALEGLAADEALRARLGEAARALAVERYDWRRITAGLEGELDRLVRSRR